MRKSRKRKKGSHHPANESECDNVSRPFRRLDCVSFSYICSVGKVFPLPRGCRVHFLGEDRGVKAAGRQFQRYCVDGDFSPRLERLWIVVTSFGGISSVRQTKECQWRWGKHVFFCFCFDLSNSNNVFTIRFRIFCFMCNKIFWVLNLKVRRNTWPVSLNLKPNIFFYFCDQFWNFLGHV